MTEPTPDRAGGVVRTTDVVARWLAQVVNVLDPGDVAALRRLDPESPSAPVFWRMVASLPARGPESAADDEYRSAVILRTFAALRSVHRPGRRLGTALADAAFDERRLLQLLRARRGALAHAIRTACHLLASHGTPVDAMGFARLVLTDGGPREEDERRHVARDYFRAVPSTKG